MRERTRIRERGYEELEERGRKGKTKKWQDKKIKQGGMEGRG